MRFLDHHMTTQHGPSHASPSFQLAFLPRVLACASDFTHDFPINTCPNRNHTRSKPSLKMRILCLASVFGLLGSSVSQSASADAYFSTELPVAKAGLLANIGPSGAKSSGAKVGFLMTAAYMRADLSGF